VKARRVGPLLALVVVSLAVAGGISAASSDGLDPVPDGTATNAVPLGVQHGIVTAAVKLDTPSLSEKNAEGNLSKGQQQAYLDTLQTQQNAVVAQASALGAQTVTRLTKAIDAVVVTVDRTKLDNIEALPNVDTVRVVRNYTYDLGDTVPYIGAAELQAAGKDGKGVRVAVLDTGVDYTHQDFGGPGTLAAYTAAYGTSTSDPRTHTRDGLFPTSKVIDGYDFTGERWPNGPLAQDDDPIDCSPSAIGCQGGHGTHVSDIIAGIGPNPGVAPGAKLLVYKVCSSVSTSCSGVALLQAVDRMMDPNQDGDISDHVDVANLSLGSPYGQDEDDLTAALNNASDAGVIVATAAGNNGNLPYVVSSPSTGKNIISVAQTQVPSAKGFPLVINSPASIARTIKNTNTVDWAPITTDVTGDVAAVGRGCPANGISPGSPEDPYLANPSGKVALIDRGACAISLKVDRAAKAGAIGVVIANNAPGDPPSFSFGGGTQFVGTIIITQADGALIKGAGSTVNVTYGPSTAIPIVGSMVSTSARGPSYSFDQIKPDIGAPGASVSAEAGTGTGKTAFGGTSGATPMIAGSEAILRQVYPKRKVFELKSVLMNTAETNIQTNPMQLPGELAPITRIGAGEVRVNRAVASTTAAWDQKDRAGSLSYGYQAVDEPVDIARQLVLRNYSNHPITYTLTPSFRYANDQATGAVTFKDLPSHVTVDFNNREVIWVILHVDPSKLPNWPMNSGTNGGNGQLFNQPEYDGYISIDGGSANSKISVPWHVLPHRSADVWSQQQNVNLNGQTKQIELENDSPVLAGRTEVFNLTGTSDAIAKDHLPGPGDNFAIIDLRSVGVRQIGPNIQFGIDTYGQRSHANVPAEFDIYIDSNNDGNFDYVVFNLENGGTGTSGQNVVEVFNLATNTGQLVFFTDADLNSGNAIMTAPMAAVGLTPSSKFTYSVFAFDNYFTGNLTDSIQNMTFTLGTPRFSLDQGPTITVPASTITSLHVSGVPGGDTASPSQLGFQFLYRDAKASGGADPGRREGQIIRVTP
jgi:minor extracellular serine protease Vpr